MRARWFLPILLLLGLAALWWATTGDAPPPTAPQAPAGAPAAAPDAATATGELLTPAATGETGRATAAATSAAAALRDRTATGYTGRVVSAAQEPVPGIGVRLVRVGLDAALPLDLDLWNENPPPPEVVVASTTTDRDGRFLLAGAPPRGLCGLSLRFADLDAAPARFRAGQGTLRPIQRAPAPGETVDLGDVVLRTGAALTGRVVGSDGPIAGALVRAARLPPLPFAAVPIERLRLDGGLIVTAGGESAVLLLPSWADRVYDVLPLAQALSGADGAFTVYGVDPGEVTVAVTAPQRASLVKQGLGCAAGQTLALGELYLADGSSTDVRVTDTAGQPVADAEVVVAPMSTGPPVHIAEPAGRTDQEGRVNVLGLPRGRALAAARRRGDAAWAVSAPGNADGELRVELPARHTVLLAVQDGGGRPVASPRVRLFPGAAGRGAVELALFGMRQPVEARQRAERLEDGRLRFAELPSGPWTFVVGAPGFATQSVDVDLRADAERLVALRPARALRVRTIDSRGEPVAAAVLHLRPRGGSRAERIVEVPLAVGRTGDDGWCTIADLPTDEAMLTAMHPEFGQVHAEIKGQPTELLLQFGAIAAIQGVLTDGGRPPAPGRWVLVLERRYDERQRRGALPDLPQLCLPGLDGSFAFAALQPGKYRVTAQDGMSDLGTVAGIQQYIARQRQILPWNKAEVDLQAGETAQVRLDALLDSKPYDGPGAVVRGVVTTDGAPAQGAVVVGTSKQPDRRVTSRVDAAGAFDLGRVPAGDLRLVVVPQDIAESRLAENLFSHSYARDLQVAPEVPLELVIELRTGEAVGEVRDAAGAAVADARVLLYDRGGEGRSSALRIVRTDARGGFRFRGLPGGTYELRAEKDGAGKQSLAGVVVAEGGTAGPFAVVLAPVGRIAGRIEWPEGPPGRPGTRLWLQPVGGGDEIAGGAQPDGRFEVRDVPFGSYAVTVQRPGEAARRPATPLEVRARQVADAVVRVGG